MAKPVMTPLLSSFWDLFREEKPIGTVIMDDMKNALVGVALLTIYNEKVSDSHDYTTYNGEQLPPISGYSMLNAVTSYYSKGGEFKSDIMDEKLLAIEKFIAKNILSSPKDLEEFLEKFMKCITDKESHSIVDTTGTE